MWVELKMEKDFTFRLLFVVLLLGVFVDCGFCLEDTDSDAVVYIVTLKQAPVSHLYGEEFRVKGHHHHNSKNHGSGNVSRLHKPRYCLLTSCLISMFLEKNCLFLVSLFCSMKDWGFSCDLGIYKWKSFTVLKLAFIVLKVSEVLDCVC